MHLMLQRPFDMSKSGERGIALVLVLWMLALLAILVVGFSGDARTQMHLARNQHVTAAAQATADAGLTFAILGVLDPTPSRQWRADGSTHVMQYVGNDLRVSVQDEGGKLDLNDAPQILISTLFRQLGVKNADQLATAIATKRSTSASDDVPAFVAIDDLRQMPGVDVSMYRVVAPFLTVYSHTAQFDPMTAPKALLLSLPDAPVADIEELIARRDSSEAIASDFPIVARHGEFLTAVPLRVFTVRSDATTATGARFVREAVVMLTPRSPTPYRIMSWRSAHRDDREGLYR